MTSSIKSNIVHYSYPINKTILDNIDEITNLEVCFDNQSIAFKSHIKEITIPAYPIYGFIFRNCRNFNNISAFSSL